MPSFVSVQRMRGHFIAINRRVRVINRTAWDWNAPSSFAACSVLRVMRVPSVCEKDTVQQIFKSRRGECSQNRTPRCTDPLQGMVLLFQVVGCLSKQFRFKPAAPTQNHNLLISFFHLTVVLTWNCTRTLPPHCAVDKITKVCICLVITVRACSFRLICEASNRMVINSIRCNYHLSAECLLSVLLMRGAHGPQRRLCTGWSEQASRHAPILIDC